MVKHGAGHSAIGSRQEQELLPLRDIDFSGHAVGFSGKGGLFLPPFGSFCCTSSAHASSKASDKMVSLSLIHSRSSTARTPCSFAVRLMRVNKQRRDKALCIAVLLKVFE